MKIVRISDTLGGECDYDRNEIWIEFSSGAGDVLRLVFRDDDLAALKVKVQELQADLNERRVQPERSSQPTTYLAKVSEMEFGWVEETMTAVLRARFEHGGTQDTALSVAQIEETIQFLRHALTHFDGLADQPRLH